MGLVNAALGLGALLADGAVDGVLNLGVAGSFDLDVLPLGSVCAATGEIWPEYGLETPHGPDAEGIGFPQARLEGLTVWGGLPLDPDAGAQAMGLCLDPGMARGVSLSVGTVTGSAQRAEALRDRHGALMENMEGFALALGCAKRGVPFLEIRAISNLTGSRRDWDLRGALAALGTAARGLFSPPRQGER